MEIAALTAAVAAGIQHLGEERTSLATLHGVSAAQAAEHAQTLKAEKDAHEVALTRITELIRLQV